MDIQECKLNKELQKYLYIMDIVNIVKEYKFEYTKCETYNAMAIKIIKYLEINKKLEIYSGYANSILIIRKSIFPKNVLIKISEIDGKSITRDIHISQYIFRLMMGGNSYNSYLDKNYVDYDAFGCNIELTKCQHKPHYQDFIYSIGGHYYNMKNGFSYQTRKILKLEPYKDYFENPEKFKTCF